MLEKEENNKGMNNNNKKMTCVNIVGWKRKESAAIDVAVVVETCKFTVINFSTATQFKLIFNCYSDSNVLNSSTDIV